MKKTIVRLGALILMSIQTTILPAPAQTKAIAERQPDSPVRISPAAPTGSPSAVSKDHIAFTCVLENASDEDVVLYAINWIWQDESGTVLTRSTYTYLWFFDPGKPVLKAGEIKTLTKDLIPSGPVLRAQIDSVLLADGVAYGRDESHSRQRFRYLLSATRSTERKILSLLESQGPEKVKDFLRKELAKEAQERNYYNPKLVFPKP